MKITLALLGFCLIPTALCSNNVSSCHGVYYPALGCFTRDPPFNNTDVLPQSPSQVATAFRLFTQRNRIEPQLLIPNNRSSVINSYFNVDHPTRIIIHGFLQSGRNKFVVNMTRALLDKGPMNVIVVAWEGGAQFPYSQAVANTRLVGAQLALLLATLVEARNVDVSNVHIIGHSLGAHIAGYTGARTSGLGRISGLDPAQPYFSNFSEVVRLDRSDADFVDIIHTDAIPYGLIGGYGIVEPIGDIDFYPNAGRHQPGCHDEGTYAGFALDLLGQGLTELEFRMSCSHERSTELFTASIIHSASPDHHQCHFRSVHCENYESFLHGECRDCMPNLCPIMGIEAPTSRARGVHYLNTTDTPNFCGFQYFVALSVSDSSMSYTYGRLELMLIGDRSSSDWTQFHVGAILPGNTIYGMVLTPSKIGNPIEVRVRAHYTYGRLAWIYRYFWHRTNYEVTLSQVKVDSIMEFVTHFFIAHGVVLREGESNEIRSPVFVSGCVSS